MGIPKITKEGARVLTDVCRRVKNLKGGPGVRVVNGPGGITISLEQTKPYTPQTASQSERWAKIIGPGTLVGSVIKYAWIQQKLTSSGWTDSDFTSTDGTGSNPDTRAINAVRPNGRTYFQPGRVVRLSIVGDTSGNSVGMFQLNDGDFSVVVAHDGGGADGAAPSTAASWTYTVKDETGTTTLKKNNAGDAATGMSPDMARTCCKTNKATRGIARYKDDGTLVLVWVDETPAFVVRSCS